MNSVDAWPTSQIPPCAAHALTPGQRTDHVPAPSDHAAPFYRESPPCAPMPLPSHPCQLCGPKEKPSSCRFHGPLCSPPTQPHYAAIDDRLCTESCHPSAPQIATAKNLPKQADRCLPFPTVGTSMSPASSNLATVSPSSPPMPCSSPTSKSMPATPPRAPHRCPPLADRAPLWTTLHGELLPVLVPKLAPPRCWLALAPRSRLPLSPASQIGRHRRRPHHGAPHPLFRFGVESHDGYGPAKGGPF
jgi:hypothetical protein